MFVILCYDIGVKRNARVHKIVRKYLHPVQKSVSEGFLTEHRLKQLCMHLKSVIDPEEDSVVIYRLSSTADLEKLKIGQVESGADTIF